MPHPTTRRLTGPPLQGPVPPHLLAGLWHWAEQEPDRPLLAWRDGDGFTSATAHQLRQRVRAIAGGLVARGVAAHDRVALLAPTSADWVAADHGILAAGAVSVPIYDTSSPAQIARILADSGAVLVLVATVEQRDLVAALAADLPAAPDVLALDDGALDTLDAEGEAHLVAVERRVAALTGDDLATLIYSSGTTGDPKGCELTHANLCSNVQQTVEHVPELFGPDARTLVFLPLAHALARVQVHAAIDQGVLTGIATDIPRLPEELELFQPTFIVAVPRIFEKVQRGARAKAVAAGRGRIFDRAADVAMRVGDRRAGARPSRRLRLEHQLFDRLVYGRIRAAFGGQLQLAICGGAALDPDLSRFFEGVGITALQGYGLTETSPIVSGGPTGTPSHRSVGQVYPGTEVQLADDGEILVRGPQVFRGYWNDPAATAAAHQDGWLRTGDLGEVTAAGELAISGRKKDIIVTAGGKNIAPGPLEERVRSHPLVDQCIVLGEGRPFVSALVFLDEAELELGGHDGDDPSVLAAIDLAVTEANASVSRGEAIRAYRVLTEALTIESGLLTPTQKLKRTLVEDRFRAEVDDLYPPPDATAR